MASGADIVVELQHAAQAFQLKDMHRFGVYIGRAWKKVLLSKVHLPNGTFTKEAIRETSSGLIKGFFGTSLVLEVRTDSSRRWSGSPSHGRISIDMDKCLRNENMHFFVEVWNATWVFFAQTAGSQTASKGTDRIWQDLLSVAFVEMPGALRRCGLNEEQQDMLQDALTAVKGFHFRMDVTSARLHNKEVSVDLQQLVKDWSKKRWYKFGEDIGKLLQQLVLLEFPHMYFMYNLELRRNLPLSFGMPQSRGQPGQHFRPLTLILAVAFASFALSALVAAVAVRVLPRSFSKCRTGSWEGLPAVEEAPDSDGSLLAV